MAKEFASSHGRRLLAGCAEALLDGKSETRLACAGRTDAGVSATGQLVSFYAPASLDANLLRDALASPELRLVGARRMCRGYHATYSTAWRRYAYFLPAETEAASVDEAARLDALLRPLGDGVARDYAALGRGVPAGKETRMLVRHAAARPVRTRAGDFVTRVDLVGDRWLRRQVRCLVATAVELADDGSDDDRRLLDAAASGVPERTAPHEAPALGLVLAEAGAADELDLEWRFGAERLCNSAELDRRLHYPLDPPDKAGRRPPRQHAARRDEDDALRRLRAAGFAAAPTAASPLGVRIEPPVAVGALLEDFVGDVEPMDEGAQLVTALVGARASESVALWGAGAAGGKALALAAAMENKGKLLVVDGDETSSPRSASASAPPASTMRSATPPPAAAPRPTRGSSGRSGASIACSSTRRAAAAACGGATMGGGARRRRSRSCWRRRRRRWSARRGWSARAARWCTRRPR